jgi:hypothetical protein
VRFGVSGCLLLSLACRVDAGPSGPEPGAQLVLEFAQAWGVAWPPAWCKPGDPSHRSCLRMLPDSSDAVLYWVQQRRPFSVTRSWSGVPPIRGVDLRDSLRQALERRGARRLSDVIGPEDPEHHVHHTQMRWCLDSALVSVGRSWQEGYRLEGVNILIGAVLESGCSGEPRPGGLTR